MNDTKQDLLDYLKNVNIESDLSNIDMFSTISIADGFSYFKEFSKSVFEFSLSRGATC